MLLARIYFGDVLPPHAARIEGERSVLGPEIDERLLLVGVGSAPSFPPDWDPTVIVARDWIEVIRSVRGWLRRLQPDVVHSHTLWPMLVSAMALGWSRTRVKLVFEMHGAAAYEARMRRGGLGGLARFGVLYLLESIALLVAHRSLLVSSTVVKYYPAARVRPWVTIPRVVESNGSPSGGGDGQPEAEAARHFAIEARSRGQKVVVYSGSLSAWQMFPTVAEFMAQCTSTRGCAALVMTPEPGAAREQLNAVEVAPDCSWVGRVSPEDVGYVLQECDVGLLFREHSVVNAVASPTKFFEYLASGLHVIGTPGAASVSYEIEQHGLGLVCEKEDLSEALEWLGKVDRSNEEVIRIRRVVREHFTWDSFSNTLRGLYDH